ncbi:type II CAAX prenyl endopeptidase Rce1 family protein [Streptomyces cinerochromogenes]|uniref:Type II CAAX prenyl endopeptidase Rce1 family protein n=1 Tax=Streptomyces cinerochromogenes TaxID=66422 RepID=A0ABW7B6G3_9ACTN
MSGAVTAGLLSAVVAGAYGVLVPGLARLRHRRTPEGRSWPHPLARAAAGSAAGCAVLVTAVGLGVLRPPSALPDGTDLALAATGIALGCGEFATAAFAASVAADTADALRGTRLATLAGRLSAGVTTTLTRLGAGVGTVLARLGAGAARTGGRRGRHLETPPFSAGRAHGDQPGGRPAQVRPAGAAAAAARTVDRRPTGAVTARTAERRPASAVGRTHWLGLARGHAAEEARASVRAVPRWGAGVLAAGTVCDELSFRAALVPALAGAGAVTAVAVAAAAHTAVRLRDAPAGRRRAPETWVPAVLVPAVHAALFWRTGSVAPLLTADAAYLALLIPTERSRRP